MAKARYGEKGQERTYLVARDLGASVLPAVADERFLDALVDF